MPRPSIHHQDSGAGTGTPLNHPDSGLPLVGGAPPTPLRGPPPRGVPPKPLESPSQPGVPLTEGAPPFSGFDPHEGRPWGTGDGTHPEDRPNPAPDNEEHAD